MQDKAMRVSQVAKRYGVNVDKVHAWIRSGELRAINIAKQKGPRPRYAILPEDLTAFENSRTAVPRPEHYGHRRSRRYTRKIKEYV